MHSHLPGAPDSQCSVLISSWKSCLVFFFIMDSQAPMSTQPREQSGPRQRSPPSHYSPFSLQQHMLLPPRALPHVHCSQHCLGLRALHLHPAAGQGRHLRRLSRRCSCFNPFSSWETKFFICLMSIPRRRCKETVSEPWPSAPAPYHQ